MTDWTAVPAVVVHCQQRGGACARCEFYIVFCVVVWCTSKVTG